MSFIRFEEFTLPARFFLLLGHFVTVLAVVFGRDDLATGITLIDPAASQTSPSEMDDWNNTRDKISGLSIAAAACCGVEIVSLFMGTTIFFHKISILNGLAHGAGIILLTLFYSNRWNVDSLIAFCVVFNYFPTVVEMFFFVFITHFNIVRY